MHNKRCEEVIVHLSKAVPTRGEVISLFAKLGFAVKFLLSEPIQQTLILVFLAGQRRPLVDRVGSAANTVTHQS